jgi:hypothetical protein
MLIPSKFNGYVKNVRLYNAMGGVGEAMLLGAAMGGGSAALTGGDPLKGALLGGLTGGVGGAISPALSAMTGGVPAAAIAPAAEAGVAAGAAGAAPVAATTNLAALSPGVAPSAIPSMTQNLAAAANPGATTGLSSASTTANALRFPNAAGLPSSGANYNLGTPSIAPGGGGVNYALGSPAIAPGGGIANLPINPAAAPVRATGGTFGEGMQRFISDPMASIKANPMTAASAAFRGATGARKDIEEPDEYDGPLKRFRFNPDTYRPAFYAEGGIANLAAGGYDRMVGEQPMYQSMARGGISNLGSYSDGGRMLRGPGDGMSDSIPASISGKRPARLADGEFVVPADVVSHLGNGSTDAGAKQLYAMMNKVRQARTGRKAQGREIDPRKYTPAYA